MVFEVGFSHFDRRGRWCVERRAGFQQANDFRAAVTGTLDDRVQFFLSGPAHFHQIRQRDACDGGVTGRWHHGVAVAAQNESGDIFHGHVKFFGQEVAEARGVQNTRHAADFLVWQAGEFTQRPNHRVQRVGDADHERLWRVVADAFANGLHDFQVDAQKVVAGHAWLTWHTCGHDADVRACDVRVILGAFQLRVKTLRWAGFRDVESFALWGAFCDVEQNNVAEFFKCCEVGKCAADLTCADEGNLGSSHWKFSSAVEIGGVPKRKAASVQGFCAAARQCYRDPAG